MEHLVELGASGAAASGRALGVILRKLERQLLDQLIHAHTRRAAEVLLVQLSGRLREELGRIGSLAAPAEMRGALDQLRATYSYGRRLAEPSAVVITGAPNVGKSALANALVGRERSIVHHLPGTTRDAVTAVASFDGLPVTVVDTAGLRQAADEIERLGVGRALEKASSCDLVVWVFDHSRAVSRDEAGYLQLLPRSRLVPVVNKIDLEGPTGDDEIRDMLGMEALRTSAVTGSGIEELRTRICTCLVGTDVPARDAAVVTLSSVDSVLAEAAHALKSGETLKPLLEGILAD
jgi:tRNA modification GTPase